MSKKLPLIFAILCTACSSGINSGDKFTSYDSNDAISNESSFTSSSSENISTSSDKDTFETPKNTKIENGIFSWNKVDGATNGYRIRINSKNTIDTQQTSLLISNHVDKLIIGLNTFEVRVNSNDSHYISSYSTPVNYLFGVNEEKANDFIEKVNGIGEVNENSFDKINEAKTFAKSLEDVDFLVNGVNEAYSILEDKESQYFLLCVNKALSIYNTNDYLDEKKKIEELYENLLNISNQYVVQALNIAFDYNVDTQVFTNDFNETVLYIFAAGFNIFDEKLTNVRPVVKQGDYELAVSGNNGIYSSIITDDATIYYGGNEIETIFYNNCLSGYIVGITGENNLSFGYNGDETISKYKVYIFNNDDVDLSVAHRYSFNALPLVSFETTSNPFMLSKARNVLIEAGYVGKKEVRLVIEAIDESGKRSKVSLESIESISRTFDLDTGLKISSPLDVWNVTPTFLSNGDLDYKWEMINANSEFSEGLIKSLEFRIYDASLTFEGIETETLAIINRTSGGFITSNDVISSLKVNNIFLSFTVCN